MDRYEKLISRSVDENVRVTGERFVPNRMDKSIQIEHLHRYLSINNLIEGKIVLDAACGEGYGSFLMSELAQEVYGIDIDEKTIRLAKSKYENTFGSNLEFIHSSVEKLPFNDSTFDVIVSFETIEHVPSDVQNKFLQEAIRVLKNDGILIISTPDKKNYSDLHQYNNPYHIKEFYKKEFHEFLGQFFNNVAFLTQDFKTMSLISDSTPAEKNGEITYFPLDAYENSLDRYIIAICGNFPLKNTKRLQSVMQYKQANEFVSNLYIDDGNGYTQDHQLSSIPQKADHMFYVEFSLIGEKSVGNIRFDPLEGQPCYCKIDKVETDGISHGIFPLNSDIKEENTDLFVNTDPMYELSGDFQKATYIRIFYWYKTINYHDLCDLFQKNVTRRWLCGKLYYDTGEGFDEERCITLEYKNEKTPFSHKIELPDGVKKLRFDPVKGYNCKCTVLHAFTENEEVVFRPFNATVIDGASAVFLTENPMYLSDSLKNQNSYNLTIKGTIEIGIEDETVSGITALINTNAQLISEQAKEIEKSLSEINRLFGHVEESRQRRCALTEELENSKRQFGEAKTELERIKASRGYRLLMKMRGIRDKFGCSE